MFRSFNLNNYTKVAALSLLLIATKVCVAQSMGPVSAFTTCMDASGDAFLCAQTSWDLAMGYTSDVPGASASLSRMAYTPEAKIQECGQLPTPSRLEISLFNSNLRPGDRITLADFTIDAYDEAGNFLPELPVLVWVLSQHGMFETESSEDYVDIYSYGYATFTAEFYCNDVPGPGGDTGLTVAP